MTNDEEILIGAASIGRVLGGVTPKTIGKYIREYPTMPIRKIGGQLTAHRGELRRWWQFFCTDSVTDYRPLSREK